MERNADRLVSPWPSKTPLTMYLAQRGSRTGNVPIVPGLEIPSELLELTLIDAVIAACELSEDETEVSDLVDAMVRRPDVRVVAEPRPAAPWAQLSDRAPRAAA